MSRRIRIALAWRSGALAAAATILGVTFMLPSTVQAQTGAAPAPGVATVVGLDSAAAAALVACRRLEAYGRPVVVAALKSLRERGVLAQTIDSVNTEAQRPGRYNDAYAALFGLTTLPDSIKAIIPKARPSCSVVPSQRDLQLLVRMELAKLPKLGVGIEPLNRQTAAARGVSDTTGLLVTSVSPTLGAHAAGIVVGDVIVAIDGKSVTSPTELRAVSAKWKNGDKIKVAVSRKGTRQEMTVEVRGRP